MAGPYKHQNGHGDAASPLLGVGGTQHAHHRLYRSRWGMLAIIMLLQISTGTMWITFAPITRIAEEHYGTSALGIDMLSMVFMIVSVPLIFTTAYMLDAGLRQALILAALVNMLGAWVRYLAESAASPSAMFGTCMLGQIICAAAQMIILDSPTVLAARWFGEHERAEANTIASVSNPIGVAIGSVVSPLLVSHSDDMPFMLMVLAIPATLATLVTMFFFRDRPPTPPSASAGHASENFWEGLSDLGHNRPYWILASAFGVGVGIVNAVSTLVGQIVNAKGYSDAQAGYLSAFLVGFGLVGAGVAGVFVDKTQRYITSIRASFIGATLALALLAIVNQPGQFKLVAMACSMLGFFCFSALPVALELAVETSYPVGEGTSASFMWLGGQVFGVLFIFIMNSMKGKKHYYPDDSKPGHPLQGYGDMTTATWFMACLAGVATVLLLMFNTEYKRIKAEKADAAQEEAINA